MDGYPHHRDHNISSSTNTPLLSPALADIDALREGLHNLLPLLGHSSVMDPSSSSTHTAAASTNYAALAPPSLLSRLISAYSAALAPLPTAANWPDPLSAVLLHHLSGQTVPPLGLLQSPFITSPVVCLPSACPLEERQSVIQLVENGTVMPMCFEPAIIFPNAKPNASESVAVETNSPAISLHSSPSSSIGSSCRTRSSTVNRLSYPREFKLMVIECYLANGQNKYRTCKEFRITKSMLNSWLQKESKIRASKPGSLKSGRSGRKPQFPKIEKQLFDLYSKETRGGKRPNNKWLRESARSLARQETQQSDGECEPSPNACQFSERWLSNFKKRYGILDSIAAQ